MSDDAKDPKDEAKDESVSDDAKTPAGEDSKAEDSKGDEKAADESSSSDDSKTEDSKADEKKADEKADAKADEKKAGAEADEKKADAEADEKKADAKADEKKADTAKAEEAPAEEAPAEEAPADAPAASAEAELHGMLVEFDSEESLKAGCAKVRDAGYSRWDAHTPYPVHGLDQAMGVKATILPWIVFCGGLTGCLVGLGLQLYTNGVELPMSLSNTIIDPFLPSGYPYVVSGKPVFSVQANIPVIFELTILLSAFGAFFGMWGLNLLPRFHHPVFLSERFKRASQDRYFISIEARDPLFDRERTRRLATSLGGTHVEELVSAVEG